MQSRNSIIFILWCLVIAKCLTLEYLVQVYAVPINSVFYVWILTFSMAIVAMVTQFKIQISDKRSLDSVPLSKLIVFICIITGILTTIIILRFTSLSPFAVPAVIAFLIGVAYVGYGLSEQMNAYVVNGVGWWVGSAILAARDHIENLSKLAFFIILLSVIPTIFRLRKQKRAFL